MINATTAINTESILDSTDKQYAIQKEWNVAANEECYVNRRRMLQMDRKMRAEKRHHAQKMLAQLWRSADGMGDLP